MLKGCRIVFVLGNLQLGGAERPALILARYLSQQEQAIVEIWGFNKLGPVAEICEQHGLRSRVIPYPFTASRFKLANDPALRASAGAENRKRIREKYDSVAYV